MMIHKTNQRNEKKIIWCQSMKIFIDQKNTRIFFLI